MAVSVLALSAAATLADSTLVNFNEAWRYRKGTSAPQADWKTAPDQSLDNTWLTGNGGFGYADNAAETGLCQTLLGDMKGAYTTLAMRKSFEVAAPLDPSLHLQLTMDYDDGFVAWLDGVLLASGNSPNADPAYDAKAPDTHESSRGNSGPEPATRYDLGPAAARLPIGTHILAILGLNQSSSSSDFIQIPTLAVVSNGVPGTNCLSGFISSQVIVHATNSPYTFCADLTIGAGATLAIEPGTTIYLESGVNLVVQNGGQLLAEGSETNRIHFTAAPDATAWGGIRIEGAGNSPESRLAYVDFDGNSRVCLEVAGGTLYLDHATFGTTTRQYVSLDGSSFVISHCYFPSSTVSFELLHGTGGIKAGGRGVVRDCFFGTTSDYADIMDFTGGNRPDQPIIQFYNNVFVGASDDILDLDGTDAWIEGNIFLHSHKNGTTPDSSAAVSGGSNGSATSQITILRNLFYDCDQAATAKQGNFYTLFNNTIVHMTKTGGMDSAAGVVNVRDVQPTLTSFAAGYYLEGNIIVDAEQLVRNYDPQQTTVTFVNNLLPMAWNGPGQSNRIGDPLLKHIPALAETYFTNWADAQVLWDWFSLQPGSSGLGAGPFGRDQGAVIPPGVSVAGEPQRTTTQTSATLVLGINRRGNGIPVSGWPNGSGYTEYRWQLDAGPWSDQTPITSPIVLTNLSPGTHQVAVIGRNDAGLDQNDPALGTNAVVSLSRPWMVESGVRFASVSRSRNEVMLQFIGAPGQTYTVEYKDRLEAAGWSALSDVTTDPQSGAAVANDPNAPGPERFYRLKAR